MHPKVTVRVVISQPLNPALEIKLILLYTNFSDPWIAQLNTMIKPTEIRSESIQVAYSPTELQDRITQAQNTIDIRKSRVGSFGKAPYIK